ncbi:hypothetical protein VOLCADRAFT_97628 [Volvox carteri f. nagariensis]|uniref:Protein kinase domain-containing protein n=1 Tax=Volvox carteri f. nagariensis TaxID=3068 RepID=D8UD78_VOLCA|nr:uncharacterized protein VOLCADRAFT_97628 [Volvox carteri f. nagariensis]EFJ42346.1 hypothetical protein VOLCADRAFT_97628 [Volvox carteri f. nagariensis]|eukprot:XP_002956579.1 hypothetical protein VOLCADRAFT_97628 [Volvox carteri f. nagariensis]
MASMCTRLIAAFFLSVLLCSSAAVGSSRGSRSLRVLQQASGNEEMPATDTVFNSALVIDASSFISALLNQSITYIHINRSIIINEAKARAQIQQAVGEANAAVTLSRNVTVIGQGNPVYLLDFGNVSRIVRVPTDTTLEFQRLRVRGMYLQLEEFPLMLTENSGGNVHFNNVQLQRKACRALEYDDFMPKSGLVGSTAVRVPAYGGPPPSEPIAASEPPPDDIDTAWDVDHSYKDNDLCIPFIWDDDATLGVDSCYEQPLKLLDTSYTVRAGFIDDPDNGRGGAVPFASDLNLSFNNTILLCDVFINKTCASMPDILDGCISELYNRNALLATTALGGVLWWRRRRQGAAAAKGSGQLQPQDSDKVVFQLTMDDGAKGGGARGGKSTKSSSGSSSSGAKGGGGGSSKSVTSPPFRRGSRPTDSCGADPTRSIQLQHLLGAGSFGRVYYGTWHRQGVAVKIIPHSETANAKVQQEIALVTKFNHPNVVRSLHCATFDVGSLEQSHTAQLESLRTSSTASAPPSVNMETWIVLEYCDASSLAAHLGARAAHIAAAAERLAAAAAAATARTATATATVLCGTDSGRCGGGGGPGGDVVLATAAGSGLLASPVGSLLQHAAAAAAGAGAGAGVEPAAEAMEGCPLLSHMRDVLSVALDIAAGMAYLHSLSVCHGDLKCENVLLCTRKLIRQQQQQQQEGKSTPSMSSSSTLPDGGGGGAARRSAEPEDLPNTASSPPLSEQEAAAAPAAAVAAVHGDGGSGSGRSNARGPDSAGNENRGGGGGGGDDAEAAANGPCHGASGGQSAVAAAPAASALSPPAKRTCVVPYVAKVGGGGGIRGSGRVPVPVAVVAATAAAVVAVVAASARRVCWRCWL